MIINSGCPNVRQYLTAVGIPHNDPVSAVIRFHVVPSVNASGCQSWTSHSR